MAKKKWMSSLKLHEGALTKKAKAAGMSISAYCAQSNLSGKSKKQCTLYKTFRKAKKG